MTSTFNIADSNNSEDIVISNASHLIQRHLQGGENSAEVNRALELSSILQSTMDLETIFQLFTRETQKAVSYTGILYMNKELNLNFSYGKRGRFQCHYRLLVGSQKLGELTVFRGQKFKENETVSLEYLLSSLLYPLRNAILYTHALRSALRDPLTGVNNRASFEASLQREVDMAHRHETNLCMVIADIDHFKKINDDNGHLYGDCILREVAQRIQKSIRRTDILFRYGGEEFVVLLANTSPEGAHLTAERIRFGVAKSNAARGDGPEVTVSLGGTELRKDDTPTDLFARADSALYQAKSAGRNCVCFDTKIIKS